MAINISGKMSETEILALISSAAVLRKYVLLKDLFNLSKKRKVSSKKIYEALLQTYLFSGFPSALLSLQIFSEYFPQNSDRSEVKRNHYNEGIITAKKIYGDKLKKLTANIRSFSPEMSRWFIEEGYGKILSRRGLSLKERELCNVSILSSLKFESQLYSHINGAYRQRAKITEIKKIITNLELIGNKQGAKFGLKVLSRFIEQKRTE